MKLIIRTVFLHTDPNKKILNWKHYAKGLWSSERNTHLSTDEMFTLETDWLNQPNLLLI